MTTLRIAILGTGLAARMHSRTLRRFPNVERAYASRNASRAADFNSQFGGVAAFGSYEEAIHHPATSIVLIASPPDQHLALTRAALEAGKHVIVEKPPFLQSTDFNEVETLAAAAGRQVMVAENYYYKPILEAIRKALADNLIGEPLIVTVNALKEQTTGDWRDNAEVAGGGAMFEGGIHWVSFLASLGPSVTAVHGFRPGSHDGPDRTMVAVFEYQNGMLATLCYSWDIGSPSRGLRLSSIYGTEGAITFESNGLMLAVRGRRKQLKGPSAQDLLGYKAMFRDFLSAITTGQPPRYNLALARRDLQLVEDIYKSARRPHGHKPNL